MNIKKNVIRSTLCGISMAMISSAAHAVVSDDEGSVPAAQLSTQSASSAADTQLIVKYKNSTLQAQGLTSMSSVESQMSNAAGHGMKVIRRMSTGAYVMKLSGEMTGSEMSNVMQQLAANSEIEYAEPDRWMQIMATPSDPQYNNQWHYYEASGGLNLPTAWDTATGTGAVVAVIDTGYTEHADLLPNLLPGYDMISSATIGNDGNGRDSDARDTGDATNANECRPNTPARSSSWHGTHVAGTVAAAANNGIGVAGVAYNAKIVPIRALGRCGGRTSDIADAMIWAAGGNVPGIPNNPNPADVLNLSLGGGGACDTTSQSAINQAVSLGATVVVAAGNSNQNASNATPANCNNVVTVAAVGRTGGRASYSNFGAVVDVAAPGGDQRTGRSDGVLSTLNSGQTSPAGDIYEYYQGTSMAAPHVAGAAALLYSLNPSITPAAVENILETTARSFPATCSGCGAGIVDAAAAVAALSPTDPDPEDPTPGDSVLVNGAAKTGLSGALNTNTFYTLEVPAGASDLSFAISGGNGDADLYVRFAAQPTTSTYDCRPFRNGNAETCTISNVQAGTYYVMLRAYAAYSGVSLVANYSEGGTPTEPDSISETGISGARNAYVNFQLEVPAGQSSLNVAISGGSGDADLYVRFGSNPTTTTYDCRPFRNGNSETCTINNPQAGTYFIRLRGYRAFSGVSLQASSQ